MRGECRREWKRKKTRLVHSFARIHFPRIQGQNVRSRRRGARSKMARRLLVAFARDARACCAQAHQRDSRSIGRESDLDFAGLGGIGSRRPNPASRARGQRDQESVTRWGGSHREDFAPVNEVTLDRRARTSARPRAAQQRWLRMESCRCDALPGHHVSICSTKTLNARSMGACTRTLLRTTASSAVLASFSPMGLVSAAT